MANDWKPEARGIPVWEGAFIVTPAGNVDGPVEEIDGTMLILRGGSTQYPAAFCGPALSHADTCAAFLRRLAIRLGCPEEVAGEGVIASVDTVIVPASCRADGLEYRSVRLFLSAGHVKREDYIDAETVWSENVEVGTDNRILALVRAWRSVGEQLKEQA